MKKFMVLGLALVFVLGLSAMAPAAVKVGGDVRLELAYAWTDEDYNGIEDTVELWNFHGSSTRLKVSYITDDKKYEAYLETGIYSHTSGNANSTRQAWFQYNFSNGFVRLGQGYSANEGPWMNQWLESATSLIGYGNPYFGREELVRVNVGKKYKFMFQASRPTKGDVWGGVGYTYHVLPALAFGGDFSFGNVSVQPCLRFENIQWKDGSDTDYYNSWDFGLALDGNFGLIGFTVEGTYGINSAGSSPFRSTPSVDINNEVDKDVHCYAVWGELRIAGLSLGGGYTSASFDPWDQDPYKQSLYANYVIPFGAIEFRPEIVWFGEGEDENGVDQGNKILFGVFSRLAF